MGTEDDYVTLCPFCDSCFNLAVAGMAGSGLIVWVPELTQAELNNIVRAAYVARAVGGKVADLADRALDAFKMRRTEAKKRLGSDDPLLLATAFQESLSKKEYAERAAKLEGLRFFPLDKYLVRGRVGEIDQFPQMLGFWRSSSGPYGATSPDEWIAMFEKLGSEAVPA
jgi:intracellular multiplication protein IcmJ